MENLQEPLQFMQNQLKNIFIFSETNLFQTIRVFREYQLSLLPVIDVDKTYLGYIQPADIIAEIGSVNYDATTTMTIIVEKKDYNLHEISRLIQENNGAILLDVRSPNEFEKEFISGSINIGKSGMFAPWVGTIIPSDKSIVIVCHPSEEIEVISRLARVGYENVIGYISSLEDWKNQGKPIDSILSIDAKDLTKHLDQDIIMLDVRKPGELQLGVVKNSINIPLDKLQNNIDKLKKNHEIIIYCAGGYRSMIASSILKAKGYNNVKNIYGGFSEISKNANSLA